MPTTFEVGDEIVLNRNGGAEFEGTVITVDWARFELAQKQATSVLAPVFLDRIDLLVSRVRQRVYDELMVYLVGVPEQGGVGFVYRISKNWLIESIPGNNISWPKDERSWTHERINIRRK